MKASYLFFVSVWLNVTLVMGQQTFESDTIQTSSGILTMNFIEHGTLMFSFNDAVIQIDPVGRYADYAQMPQADLILVTHHHGDHLDPDAIGKIVKDETIILCSESCLDKLPHALVMKNGDLKSLLNLTIQAVPAYNIVHKRSNGEPFHPMGVGNGYVITFGDKKVYVAGDTENIPEMADLDDIYCAFLPMNLPYTMTPEMVRDAVEHFHPTILYPYHYGNTDVNELIELLDHREDLEVRIRKLN